MPFQPCLLCWPILIAKHSTPIKQLLVALGSESLRPLFAALQSENPALKIEVIDVLGLLGATEAVPFLALPATIEGELPRAAGGGS